MKLILMYAGMVLAGYALHYGGLPLVLFGCAFFAQATGLLLVDTRPEADMPRIGFGTVFAMSFFVSMGFVPLSYEAVPILPLLLSLVVGLVARRFLSLKDLTTRLSEE